MPVLLVLELLVGWAALGGAMIPRAHARTIQVRRSIWSFRGTRVPGEAVTAAAWGDFRR